MTMPVVPEPSGWVAPVAIPSETRAVYDAMADVFTSEDFARWRADALAKADADEKRRKS